MRDGGGAGVPGQVSRGGVNEEDLGRRNDRLGHVLPLPGRAIQCGFAPLENRAVRKCEADRNAADLEVIKRFNGNQLG